MGSNNHYCELMYL